MHKPLAFALALAALATIIVAAPAAAAVPSYQYSPGLRGWVHESLELASENQTHGKTIPWPVEVRCYTDSQAFWWGAYRHGRSPADIPGIVAFYDGGNTVHIRNATCVEATYFTRGSYTAETVGAFTTLLHEALHRQGFRNENLTEAFAIAAMFQAGIYAQYQAYMRNGAVDRSAAFQAATPTGKKVLQIAFNQSNRALAPEYRTTWQEVMNALTIGWAGFLGR